MMKKYKKAIDKLYNFSLFYKYAISDFPDWIPEHHKKRLLEFSEPEKDIRLVNFRENMADNVGYTAPYENDLMSEIKDKFIGMKYNFEYIIRLDMEEAEHGAVYGAGYEVKVKPLKIKEIFGNYYIRKIDDIKKLIASLQEFNLKTSDRSEFIEIIRSNDLFIDKSKIKLNVFYKNKRHQYNTIINIFNEAAPANARLSLAPEMQELKGYKQWTNRAKEKDVGSGLQIVFTTKVNDILGMSSRSEWNSCQDLRPGSTWHKERHNLGLLGSCISKNIGIIYLTDATDFEGRGEKMIYRATIWIVRDAIEKKDVLFIQQVYPENSVIVGEIFKKILQEKLQMPATLSKYNLFKYIENFKFNEEKEQPYSDNWLGRYVKEEALVELAKREPMAYFFKLTDLEQRSIIDYIIEHHDNAAIFIKPHWDNYYDLLLKAGKKYGLFYVLKTQPAIIENYNKFYEFILKLLGMIERGELEYKIYELLEYMVYLSNNGYDSISDSDTYKHIALVALSKKEAINPKFLKKEWKEYPEMLRLYFNEQPNVCKNIKYINMEWEEAEELLLHFSKFVNDEDEARILLEKAEGTNIYDEVVVNFIKRMPELCEEFSFPQEIIDKVLLEKLNNNPLGYVKYATINDDYISNVVNIFLNQDSHVLIPLLLNRYNIKLVFEEIISKAILKANSKAKNLGIFTSIAKNFAAYPIYCDEIINLCAENIDNFFFKRNIRDINTIDGGTFIQKIADKLGVSSLEIKDKIK